MKIELDIKEVVVFLTNKNDIVYFVVNKDPPFPPKFKSDNSLLLKFEATQDQGEAYVKNNFNIEPEVISIKI